MTELGTAYGQIDLEAQAAARPDVIVTHAYPVDAAGTQAAYMTELAAHLESARKVT